MKFSKQLCNVISNDVLAALKVVEEKHGVKFTRGSGNYSDTDFTCKLVCQAVGDNGENIGEKTAFERDAQLFGFKPEHYGKVFTSPQGGQYRLTGFNYRARSMPIQAKRVSDGAAFKFPGTMKDLILKSLV